MLNTVSYDSDGTAPPLLIAHGLFGSARNWGVIARRLSDRGPVAAVDMRNHGESFWSDDHSYPAMAGDLAEVIDGQWDVLGHSMGGKAAMTLALMHPGKVRRLVVADIAPVAYGHSQSHLIEAMRGVDPTCESRAEARAQLAVRDEGVAAFLLQSLDRKEGRWRLNLDVLEREMDGITGWHGPEGRFEGEVLFLSGGESDYVRPEHRETIQALFPKARFVSLPGTGHWLHAESPRDFETTVRLFLDK